MERSTVEPRILQRVIGSGETISIPMVSAANLTFELVAPNALALAPADGCSERDSGSAAGAAGTETASAAASFFACDCGISVRRWSTRFSGAMRSRRADESAGAEGAGGADEGCETGAGGTNG